MNRREFLTRFLATAAGAAVAHTLDLDKLLWVPGAKRFFLPPEPPKLFSVAVDWGQFPPYLAAIERPPVWCDRCQCWHRGVDMHAIIREGAQKLADDIDRIAWERYLDTMYLDGDVWPEPFRLHQVPNRVYRLPLTMRVSRA